MGNSDAAPVLPDPAASLVPRGKAVSSRFSRPRFAGRGVHSRGWAARCPGSLVVGAARVAVPMRAQGRQQGPSPATPPTALSLGLNGALQAPWPRPGLRGRCCLCCDLPALRSLAVGPRPQAGFGCRHLRWREEDADTVHYLTPLPFGALQAPACQAAHCEFMRPCPSLPQGPPGCEERS